MKWMRHNALKNEGKKQNIISCVDQHLKILLAKY